MRIGQVDINCCAECPAIKWRGESLERTSQWDMYCGFTRSTLAFDHRQGIATNCPLDGISFTPTKLEDMTIV